MRIHKPSRSRQPAPIDETRMILGIAKYRVAFISQRRHDARIRGESRRKHERRLRTLERSKLSFQLRMRFTPPAHEWTSTAAPALTLTRNSSHFTQPLIRSQSQIVIRTKINQFTTIEHDTHGLRTRADGKPAE